MKHLSTKHKEALKRGWEKRKASGLGEAWNKGTAHTEEHKENLKKAWLKRKEKGLGEAWNKGKILSPEHAKKVRKARVGKKHSEETKKKMSEDRLGRKNYHWKGDDAGYRAMHTWVERLKGKASSHKCVFCNKQARHWANIDHSYRRNTNDYIALCAKCHKRFDK